MHPPSDQYITLAAVHHLLRERRREPKTEAVFLVDAVIFSPFYKLLVDEADVHCLLAKQVAFTDAAGSALEPSPFLGQSLFYFGEYVEDFVAIFSDAATQLVTRIANPFEAAPLSDATPGSVDDTAVQPTANHPLDDRAGGPQAPQAPPLQLIPSLCDGSGVIPVDDTLEV